MTYKVFVDDNFHYMDESERYQLGDFDSLEAAVAACKTIVDEFLISSHRPGMTSAELLTQYAFYGEDPFVFTGDGVVHFSARDYASERIREICRELDPKYAEAYYNRGAAYSELGDHQKAIRDYDKAIELNPKYVEAYYNRGIAYHRLEDYQQAIKDYDRAIELDPKYAEAYYNRGVAYHRLEDYQQAIDEYKIAARLGYKNAQDFLKSQGISW